MTPLELQKQTLALQSELNRLAFRAEFQQLRDARTWTGFMKRSKRRMASWAFVLAPLAGVVLALGLRRTTRLLGSAARFIKAARECI